SVARKQLHFCSCFGTAHSDLPRSQGGFSFPHRGWGRFHKQSIFEPGEPQRENACGFFQRAEPRLSDDFRCYWRPLHRRTSTSSSSTLMIRCASDASLAASGWDELSLTARLTDRIPS